MPKGLSNASSIKLRSNKKTEIGGGSYTELSFSLKIFHDNTEHS